MYRHFFRKHSVWLSIASVCGICIILAFSNNALSFLSDSKTPIGCGEMGRDSEVVDWQRTYGGSQPDRGYSVHQTLDGGFFITGSTFSYGSSINCEALMIKTDSSGISEWQQHHGLVKIDTNGSNSNIIKK